MNGLKITGFIGFIIAEVMLIFGYNFILGSGSAEGSSSWFGTGVLIMLIGLVLAGGSFAAVSIAKRREAQSSPTNITLNVDLPANVSMDTIKCKSCGGALTSKDINMVAGAPVVTCPYCNTTYQLTEEVKW